MLAGLYDKRREQFNTKAFIFLTRAPEK